jgi:hypothetical protein
MTNNHKLYFVVWIDDQCKVRPGLILNAKQNDIVISPFELAIDGLNELENNPSKYDGVILDVKCLYASRDEVDSSASFYKTRKELRRIADKLRIEIPCFVYSGQPDYTSNEEFENYLGDEKLYIKGADDRLLLEDIKKTADNRLTTQIRHKYLDSLNRRLPDNINMELTDILSYVENSISDKPDVFPKMRTVINWLMDELNAYGLLAVKHNGANINACSVYLGKKELSQLVPIHIQRSFHSCVEVCNNGSHRIEVFNTVQDGRAPFLIRSTIFELLNILSWFCSLPTDEMSIAQMKELVARVPPDDRIIEGELKKDEEEIYYCCNCMIMPDKVDEAEAVVGDWIRITETTETKGRRAEKYPRFAKKVERQ